MKKVDTALGISLDFSYLKGVNVASLEGEAVKARAKLDARDGAGGNMLGWLDLPQNSSEALLDQIEGVAARVQKNDALVVIGIGGSYLGARAVIEALTPPFAKTFEVLFAGHQLDADYLSGMVSYLKDRRYAINVISKSGTTTEPAAAFRVLLSDLTKRFGEGALKDLVVATTDAKSGTLRKQSDDLGLESFVVPDDVGGRFSVLTPVGLVPIAVAGHNVREILAGALAMKESIADPANATIASNAAMAYAAYRNAAYRSGRKIEVLGTYVERLAMLAEWWKQLYGESEGKDKKGIFPASCNLTSDLHSLGQLLQDGERTVFETIIDVVSAADLPLPSGASESPLDGWKLNDVNRAVVKAALGAHTEGDVPCLRMEVPEISERTVGALIYFFEYACGISAYMLGVNPFDQPGVQLYKAHLTKLLAK